MSRLPLKTIIKNRLPRTLKGSFLLITVTLMMIFGIGAAIISYIIFSDSLRSNSIHAAETNLQFMRNELNSNYGSILDLALWSRTNTSVVNYISSSPDDSSYNALTREASERLGEEYLGTAANPYISRIVITNSENSKFLQRTQQSYYSVDRSVIERIKDLSYFNELLTAPDYTFSVGVQEDPLTRNPEKMLPIIRPIESLYSSDKIGFLFIQISFNMFTDPLSSFSSQEDLPVYLTICDESYRIEGKSVIQISQAEHALELDHSDMVRSDTVIQEISGGTNPGLYVSAPLAADGCWLSLPVVTGGADHPLSGFISILLIILIFVTVIGLLLMRLLSHNVTRPVALLKKQLNAIAVGNFVQNPDIEWNNELGEIGQNINLLATDISNLMEQRIADEKQKKDQEYQILQSQINPHFLYNTLNSIKWMASAQHADGIAEMTTALAHLLKSISKGTSTIVSVEDEFHLLDDYFTIQKYRYGGTVTMEYRVEDPALLKNQILRFTLQPILENAIFHGIEPKGSSGHIDIHLYRRTDQMICISLTDNGVGMDEGMINSILSGDTAARSSFFKQIGIGSVNKRLQYTFGRDYGLTITSQPGKFTCMSVLLPDKLVENIPPTVKGVTKDDKISNRR